MMEIMTRTIHKLFEFLFFSKNQFINLMSSNNGLPILDLNVCNTFTKYDKLAPYNTRVNINNPISIICLNKCWLSVQSNVSFLHLLNYDRFCYSRGTRDS